VALLELLAAPQAVTWRQFGRWCLTVLALPFVAIGWTLGLVVRAVRLVLFAVGYALAWTFAAVRVGFQSGAGQRGAA
jgi:hypothetical protein